MENQSQQTGAIAIRNFKQSRKLNVRTIDFRCDSAPARLRRLQQAMISYTGLQLKISLEIITHQHNTEYRQANAGANLLVHELQLHVLCSSRKRVKKTNQYKLSTQQDVIL